MEWNKFGIFCQNGIYNLNNKEHYYKLIPHNQYRILSGTKLIKSIIAMILKDIFPLKNFHIFSYR